MQFSIREVNSCYYAVDGQGQRIRMHRRKYACFIITVRGKIRFTLDDHVLVCDREHPVFLPKGASYLNECIEDAESYVFNFLTDDGAYPPMSLSAPYEEQVKQCFALIAKGGDDSYSTQARMLGELYLLSGALFESPRQSSAERTLQAACAYIFCHYDKASLSIDELARHCYVSEVYIRKLFRTRLDTTPFRYMTDVRMKRARMLLLEKRPRKEIAAAVGYGDVYQFSRAYKRYFGVAPSLHGQ